MLEGIGRRDRRRSTGAAPVPPSPPSMAMKSGAATAARAISAARSRQNCSCADGRLDAYRKSGDSSAMPLDRSPDQARRRHGTREWPLAEADAVTSRPSDLAADLRDLARDLRAAGSNPPQAWLGALAELDLRWPARRMVASITSRELLLVESVPSGCAGSRSTPCPAARSTRRRAGGDRGDHRLRPCCAGSRAMPGALVQRLPSAGPLREP